MDNSPLPLVIFLTEQERESIRQWESDGIARRYFPKMLGLGKRVYREIVLYLNGQLEGIPPAEIIDGHRIPNQLISTEKASELEEKVISGEDLEDEDIIEPDYQISLRPSSRFSMKSGILTPLQSKLLTLAEGAYDRSAGKSLPFDLTLTFLEDLYKKQEGRCFYSGVEMELKTSPDGNVMTIDKVIPKNGYVQSNVVLCCWFANSMKFTYSTDLFILHCQQIADWSRRSSPISLVKEDEN